MERKFTAGIYGGKRTVTDNKLRYHPSETNTSVMNIIAE
jgi:hypothetical protein